MNRRLENLGRCLYSAPVIVFIVAFAANLFVAWFYFSTYRIWNFDLAWQAEVVKSYAELREPTVEFISPGYKALGNHFSPILALAAPFYALFPHIFTLNVLMAACFALGAAILTHSAQKYLSLRVTYILGISFGLSWGFLTASGAGFHEYVLGVPFLAYALAKFIDKQWLKACIAAGVLVFVKEDVGLLLLGLGVVMAFRAKSWKPLLLSVWGGLWLLLSIKVIIPTIAGEWDFSGLVILDAEILFTDWRFKLYLLMFLVLQGGLIALRSPLFYVIGPFLTARIFTSWSAFYLIGYHYDSLTVVIVAFALLDALVNYKWKPLLRRIAIVTPAALTVLFLLLPSPGAQSWLTRDYSRDAEVIEAYEGLYAATPAGATIAADDSSITGYLDRGYDTIFIRSEGAVGDQDCVASPDDQVLGSDWSPLFKISEKTTAEGHKYELVYETKYIKLWCAP